MKTPKRLIPLIEDGLIDYVEKPLRSGKEADVYIVFASGKYCCAKVYKEKNKRAFHNQVLYQEGRNRRNSRSSRALGKHSKYGKRVEEDEWQQTEINTLFTLHNAGVCVPTPDICINGVLLMELVCDNDGEVAPQIGDIHFDAEHAKYCHDYLLRQVIRMLLAGIIHADLSEFNIVMSSEGPIIIDFPQAVDATSNNNAQFFLERDVRNLTHFFGRFEPEILKGNYGLEIWQHYSAGTLTPDIDITGQPIIDNSAVDIESVVDEIEEARKEAEERQMRREGIDPNETDSGKWEEKPKRRENNKSRPSRRPNRANSKSEPSKAKLPVRSEISPKPKKEPRKWGRR